MTFRIRDAQSAALVQSYSARNSPAFLAPLGLAAEPQNEPNVVLARDPEGASSLFELDDHGRISRYRQSSGRQFLMRYTSQHRLSGLVLPSGQFGEMKYDSENQLEEVGRDGLKWRLQYGG